MKNNVLIIGAGKIGSIRAQVIKKLSPKSRLYIFDKNLKNATKLARTVKGIVVKSSSRILKDPSIEIVVVAVTNKYSKNICLQALKNKKHVLCEKPMGRNYRDALAIFNTVKKYKKVFKCGFNHRYHPAIQEAKKLCATGKIGKLLFIRAAYGHGGRSGYEKEWRARKFLSGGGELLDQGSHLIDLCQWFFNFEEVKKSHCFAKTMFWKMDVEDNAFGIIETKSGKVAQIHASWTQWKNMFRFEVYGTKGAIEIDGLGKSYGAETLKLHERLKSGIPPKITEKRFSGLDKSWELEWRDFVRAIRANKKVMSNEYESVSVMKIINSLY